MPLPLLKLLHCALAFMLAALNVGANAQDVYLQCKGKLTIHSGALPIVNEAENIALHIKDRAILYVSGNSFITTATAAVCKAASRSEAPDELRFDSRSCTDRASGTGVYGTYNRILRRLEISDDSRAGNIWLRDGVFSCAQAHPTN